MKDELDQETRGRSERGSNSTEKSRWRIPTYSQDGKINVSAVLARKRRKATFEAARKIHGGNDELSVPAEIGLIDTTLAKCSRDILVNSMSSSTKFISSVLPCIYRNKLKSYESSVQNMVRSIAVYYSGGITGKQKYRKLYKDSCYNVDSSNGKRVRLSIHNCPLPRLVPYNRLMPYIKSIDLGTIFDVYDTLCDGLDECDKVRGCYRSLKEMVVKLAESICQVVAVI